MTEKRLPFEFDRLALKVGIDLGDERLFDQLHQAFKQHFGPLRIADLDRHDQARRDQTACGRRVECRPSVTHDGIDVSLQIQSEF